MIIRHDRQSIIKHVLRLTLGRYVICHALPVRHHTSQAIRRDAGPHSAIAQPAKLTTGSESLSHHESAVGEGDRSHDRLGAVSRLVAEGEWSVAQDLSEELLEIGKGESIREGVNADQAKNVGSSRGNLLDDPLESEKLWNGLVDHLKSNKGFSNTEEDQWYASCTQIILSATFPFSSPSYHCQRILSLPANHPGRLITPTKTYLMSLQPINSDMGISTLSIRLLQLRLLILHHQSPSLRPSSSSSSSLSSSNFTTLTNYTPSHRSANSTKPKIPQRSHPTESYFRKTTQTHIGILRELTAEFLHTVHQLWMRDEECVEEMSVGSRWFDLVLIVQGLPYRKVEGDRDDHLGGGDISVKDEATRGEEIGRAEDRRVNMGTARERRTTMNYNIDPSIHRTNGLNTNTKSSTPLNRFRSLDALTILNLMNHLLGELTSNDKRRIIKYLRGYCDLGDIVSGLDMTEKSRVDWHTRREIVAREMRSEAVLEVWRRRRGVLEALGLEAELAPGLGYDLRCKSVGERRQGDSVKGSDKSSADRGEDDVMRLGLGDVRYMNVDGVKEEKEDEQVIRLEMTQMIMDVMSEEDKYGYAGQILAVASELAWWRGIKDRHISGSWLGLQGYFTKIKALSLSSSRDGFGKAIRPNENESWAIRLLARECLLSNRLKSDMPIPPTIKHELVGLGLNTCDPVEYLRLILGFRSDVGSRNDDRFESEWHKHLTATIHLIRNGFYNARRFDDIVRMVGLLQRESTPYPPPQVGHTPPPPPQSPNPLQLDPPPHLTLFPGPLASTPAVSMTPSILSITLPTTRTKLTPKPSRSTSTTFKTRPPRFDILQSFYTASPSVDPSPTDSLPSPYPTPTTLSPRSTTQSQTAKPPTPPQASSTPSQPETDTLRLLLSPPLPNPTRPQLHTFPPPPLPGSVHSHLITSARTPSEFAKILPLLAGMKDAWGNTSLEKPVRRMLRYFADQLGDNVIMNTNTQNSAFGNGYPQGEGSEKGDSVMGLTRGNGGMGIRGVDYNVIERRDGDVEMGKVGEVDGRGIGERGVCGSEGYKDLLERCFEKWGVGFSDSVWRKVEDVERMRIELERDGKLDGSSVGRGGREGDASPSSAITTPPPPRPTPPPIPNPPSIPTRRNRSSTLQLPRREDPPTLMEERYTDTPASGTRDVDEEEVVTPTSLEVEKRQMWLKRRDELEGLKVNYKMNVKTPKSLSQKVEGGRFGRRS